LLLDAGDLTLPLEIETTAEGLEKVSGNGCGKKNVVPTTSNSASKVPFLVQHDSKSKPGDTKGRKPRHRRKKPKANSSSSGISNDSKVNPKTPDLSGKSESKEGPQPKFDKAKRRQRQNIPKPPVKGNGSKETLKGIFLKNLKVGQRGRMMMIQIDRNFAVYIDRLGKKLFFLLQQISEVIQSSTRLYSDSDL
jgi:hypothetical protein